MQKDFTYIFHTNTRGKGNVRGKSGVGLLTPVKITYFQIMQLHQCEQKYTTSFAGVNGENNLWNFILSTVKGKVF